MSANEPRESAAGVTEEQGAPNPASVEPPFTQPVPNPPVGPEAGTRLRQNAEAAELRGDTAVADEYRRQLNQAKSDAEAVGSNGNDQATTEPAQPEPAVNHTLTPTQPITHPQPDPSTTPLTNLG